MTRRTSVVILEERVETLLGQLQKSTHFQYDTLKLNAYCTCLNAWMVQHLKGLARASNREQFRVHRTGFEHALLHARDAVTPAQVANPAVQRCLSFFTGVATRATPNFLKEHPETYQKISKKAAHLVQALPESERGILNALEEQLESLLRQSDETQFLKSQQALLDQLGAHETFLERDIFEVYQAIGFCEQGLDALALKQEQQLRLATRATQLARDAAWLSLGFVVLILTYWLAPQSPAFVFPGILLGGAIVGYSVHDYLNQLWARRRAMAYGKKLTGDQIFLTRWQRFHRVMILIAAGLGAFLGLASLWIVFPKISLTPMLMRAVAGTGLAISVGLTISNAARYFWTRRSIRRAKRQRRRWYGQYRQALNRVPRAKSGMRDVFGEV